MASRTVLSSAGKARLLYAAAFLLLSVSIASQFAAGFAGDKDWLLLAAHLFVAGKKLYLGIFEINPPLILWIYSVPVRFSLWLGMEDYHALVFMALCLSALSVAVSTRMIAAHPCFAGNHGRQLHYGVLAAAILIAWVDPAYFGDREHLYFTLTLPYIIRFLPALARRPLPLWLRIVTGLMAAAGFCIKPHCMIVFAGLQAATILRERSAFILADVETLLVYMAGALYLGLALSWYPDYFTILLPMAMATYSAYGNLFLRWIYLGFCVFTFALTFIDFRLRDTSPYRRDIVYLLWVCALQLAYASLNNGWGYTYYPLSGTLLLTNAWVMWEFLYLKGTYAGDAPKRLTFGIRDCLLNFGLRTVCILIVAWMIATADCAGQNECELNDALVQSLRDNHAQSFGMLDFNFSNLPPLARKSGARFETRFNHLWMLLRFFEEDPEFTRRHQWIADYVATALAQDLALNKPDVVFIETSRMSTTRKKRLDLLAFLNTHADFSTAWQPYERVQHIDHCLPEEDTALKIRLIPSCAYDVYRRRR